MLIILIIAYRLRLVIIAAAAFYLWRSVLSPRGNDPRGLLDRGVRLFGAVLLSYGVIYFSDFGFGLYR